MWNNFEKAISHLLPYDTVAKKRATGIKRSSALISLAEVHDGPTTAIATNDLKPSIGKTGVHLRYHKHHEYKKLRQEQCREFSEWRQNIPDVHKPSYVKKSWVPSRPTQPKQILALVSQQVAAEIKKYNKSAHLDSTNTVDEAAADDEQHLMLMVQSTVAKHFATQPNQPNLIRQQLPNNHSPPSNWKAAIEPFNNKLNKST